MNEWQRRVRDRLTAASVLILICIVTGAGLAVSATAISPLVVPDQPEDLVLIASWWIAVVTAGWWISGVAYWLVRFGTSRNPPAASTARASWARFTLPGSRRVAEALLAFGLVAIPACSPDANPPTMVLIGTAPATTDLAASAVPSTITQPTTAQPTTTQPTTTQPTTVLSTVPSSAPATSTTAAPPDPGPPTRAEPTDDGRATPLNPGAMPTTPGIAAHVVLVNAGDNLWLLSAEAVERHLGFEPSLDQITRYWRLVVSANHVRSGNANLIVPGESISMPAFAIGFEASNAPGVEGAVESLLGATG